MAWRMFLASLAVALLTALTPAHSTAAAVLPGRVQAMGQDIPLLSEPNMTAEEIDEILSARNSLAAGLGEVFIEGNRLYGVNIAVVLALCTKESNCGSLGASKRTHNAGNIVATRKSESPHWGGERSGRWRVYESLGDSILDMFWLIKTKYVDEWGYENIRQLIYRYAPPFENNTEKYIRQVRTLVLQWADDPN